MIILAISSTDNNDVYQPKKIEPALILLQPISFTVLRQYTDIEPPSSWHANRVADNIFFVLSVGL